jgi:ferritin-like metal-binding protein YciE
MEKAQVDELVYQALETEMGGVKVYRMAIRCAQNPDLNEEWEKYLEQTENHERILRDVCDKLSLDAEKQTPGRQIVRHKGAALVGSMEMALKFGDLAARSWWPRNAWWTRRPRTIRTGS